MLITLNPSQINKKNILYSEKTRNNILNNGYFYRIYYSNELFTTNGIYILLNFKNIKIDKYFNKIKCIMERKSNIESIKLIQLIEHELLKSSPVKNKIPKFRIEEQLNQNFIKIFGDYNNLQKNYSNVNILLKISGIWVDETHYGVTFRFFIKN
tara:strand:- start:21 stop:482 length:462 start_codon:yes stop_codon:yes gene_type:complete